MTGNDAPPHPRFPLLAAQQRMWAQGAAAPADPAHNCGAYVEIRGDLDPVLLERALHTALAGTEALRVRFGQDHSFPWQCVVPADEAPLPRHDLSGRTGPADAAAAWMAERLDEGSDPRSGPPYEHALLTLGERHHLLFLRHHRVVADTYSRHQYLRRVAEVYTALAAGSDVPGSRAGTLTQLVGEEMAYQHSGQAARDEAYWREVLAAPYPETGPAGRDGAAAVRPLRAAARLPDEVVAALLGTAREARTRWSAVLIAALAAHLGERAGTDDVVLGLMVAGRLTRAALNTPANLANELPLRLRTPAPARTAGPAGPAGRAGRAGRAGADDAFAALVGQVSERVGGALRHQRHRFGSPDAPAGHGHGYGGPGRTSVNILSFERGLRFGDCVTTLRTLAAGPADGLRLNVSGDPQAGRGLTLEFAAGPGVCTAGELAGRLEEFTESLRRYAAAPLRGTPAPVRGTPARSVSASPVTASPVPAPSVSAPAGAS
ncbi:condensation domain-containing protein [Streptomyces sp. Ru87]|uniref:condensation domain-containing protein n=1 Tax=Streptomyces sp. Ru87 TaxID=2044307 RepID=UPI000BFA803D|nr:condensation domain-containing protein [Streptomyces sp. Ru87]PGH52649.1 hypothetical protein CRI70_00055 [Streptomyces sp. Ru87]